MFEELLLLIHEVLDVKEMEFIWGLKFKNIKTPLDIKLPDLVALHHHSLEKTKRHCQNLLASRTRIKRQKIFAQISNVSKNDKTMKYFAKAFPFKVWDIFVSLWVAVLKSRKI